MEEMIAAKDVCNCYSIDYVFINELSSYGLINVVTVQEDNFISYDDLPKVEKLIRLHQELDINVEGLEAICNLLENIEQLQHEVDHLKNKARLINL